MMRKMVFSLEGVKQENQSMKEVLPTYLVFLLFTYRYVIYLISDIKKEVLRQHIAIFKKSPHSLRVTEK